MSRIRVAITLLQCWHRVPGGTASAVLALTRAMAADGEVDLVGIGPWGRSLPPPPWTPPVPLRRFHLPYQAVYDGWARLGRPRVERLVPEADVVHATAATVPPRGSKPLVVTLYDLFPIRTPGQFTPRGARLLGAGIEAARRHADLVVCPSVATLDDCLAEGFDADRLRLVPLGVDLVEVTDADRRRVRARYGLEGPYVLWVGTIEPRKNLATLVTAHGRLGPDAAPLVVVGPTGWGEESERLGAAAGGTVRHLGFVSPEDLPALYDQASVFCFPSLREGFGLPPLEAMSHRTPVMASAHTAAEEVVADAGILLPATDVDAWAQALEALLDDEAQRQALGAAGRARAETFTWARAARQTVDIYRELVA